MLVLFYVYVNVKTINALIAHFLVFNRHEIVRDVNEIYSTGNTNLTKNYLIFCIYNCIVF